MTDRSPDFPRGWATGSPASEGEAKLSSKGAWPPQGQVTVNSMWEENPDGRHKAAANPSWEVNSEGWSGTVVDQAGAPAAHASQGQDQAAHSISDDTQNDSAGQAQDVLARLRLRAYLASHGDKPDDGRPPRATRTRWAVSLRTAVGALACVAVVVAAAIFWSSTRETSGLSVDNAHSPVPQTTAPATGGIRQLTNGVTSSVAEVVVDVAGAVAHPGLRHLPGGSRVDDAITAAGGAQPDAATDSLNLARVVNDGEQIYVPHQGEAPPGGAANGTSGGGAAGGGGGVSETRVNINQASAGQLETLPGIGPVLAARIVAYRQAHGLFTSVSDLTKVSGIGPALLDKIADSATV